MTSKQRKAFRRRAAEQMAADGRACAAQYLALVGAIGVYFAPDDVPAEIATTALTASAAMRALGRSVTAYALASEER